MTFQEWYRENAKVFTEYETTPREAAHEAWEAATQVERERCLRIAEVYDENGMTFVKIRDGDEEKT